MRILHTSDWHLGQKFITQSREPEQQMALNWLLEVIEREQADTLIVAGDIFDVNNPPVSAEEMYYRFLTNLKKTCCRHVVIVGGNHDSPSKLNAPRGLLKALDMHVVGATTGEPQDELILLKDNAGEPEVLVAAVPFLRERDFRTTTAGESVDERIRRIQEGIVGHYHDLVGKAEDFKGFFVATGHLYAKGASTHEDQQNIYLGNLDNIAAEQFPARFDYIALGHIHRMQKVGKKDHIRYCGSLIPLSFSEITDKKSVILIDLDKKQKTPVIREIPVPVFRRLLTIKGSMTEVEKKLQKAHQPADPLPAWVEVIVTGDPGVAMPDRLLRELVVGMHLEILKVRVERNAFSLKEHVPSTDLAALSIDEVFEQRCISKGLGADEMGAVKQTFNELKEWILEHGDRVK
jgi:exonuclease SbcD